MWLFRNRKTWKFFRIRRKIEKLEEILPYKSDDELHKISQQEIVDNYPCLNEDNRYIENIYLLSFNVFSIDFYRKDTGFMRNQLILGEKSLSFKTGGKSYDLFKVFEKEIEK